MARPVDDNDKAKKNGVELSPNMLLIINNAVMIIIIIIAMIIMYVLLDSSFSKKIAKIAPSAEQGEVDETGDEKQQGILLDLGSDIYNLADVNARRYLKAGIAMELTKTPAEIEAENAPVAKSGGHGHGAAEPADPNAAIIAEIERYKPAIKDAIISVLSSKTSDELSTTTGKEIAKEEILEMVNGIFEGQREVIRVSFGQFIIQ